MKKSVPNTKTKLETRSVEDFNTAWEEHKVRVRSLMKQGFFGFAGGALFVLCVWTMIISFSDETSTDGFPMILVFAALGGIGCLGLPFGWGIMNRLTGHWSIWVHIYIVIALFVFKVGLALVIGLWGYPVALVYHLIQSQKSKRGLKEHGLHWL